MRKNKTVELLVIVVLGLSIVPIGIHSTHAQVAAPGFAVTNFATGFVASGLGPIGIASDASGILYVADIRNGVVYKFGSTGGVASFATQFTNQSILGGLDVFGITFGKTGNMYASILGADQVIQLNPSTGTIVRTVATLPTPAYGIATDPLSGDLFFSDLSSKIYRISNFTSGPGTVTAFSSVQADGIAFGPDGTLYVASGVSGGVVRIAGTGSATPGDATFVASVPSIDGMAVSANPSRPVIFGNRNDGIITEVNITGSTPTLTNVVTGGTRGDFATVGQDGCLYATQTDSIIKVTNADGSCLPPPLGPLFPPTSSGGIKVSKFFTDSSLNPLPLDQHGNPMVNVVLARGTVESTNPGQVLAWINVNNTGSTPLQSLQLNETLPIDWTVNPAWLPGKGGIHVYFANTTSLATNPEITHAKDITVTIGNPQAVTLSIKNFNATGIGHPLMPGQSILLSVKLSYGLKMTSQSFASYPRNYTDTASAVAWTQASFKGSENTGTASAFFVAYAKVEGDPGGETPIILVTKYAIT